MNITWIDITRHEKSKTVATVKHLQTYAQLLQDSWTASANRTGYPDNGFLHSLCKQLWTDSFCCFLDGFCNENVYIKHSNDLQSSSNDLQSSFKWLAILSFWLSAARLCTLGCSWVNLEAINLFSELRTLTLQLQSNKVIDQLLQSYCSLSGNLATFRFDLLKLTLEGTRQGVCGGILQHGECNQDRTHSNTSLKVCFRGGAVLVTRPRVELLIHLQPSGPKVAVVAHATPLLPQLELGA